ncbi:AraC family transcriptional regulator [Salinisphaera sp. Q1T1-3]|uniref:AraC family transcriptional regulator n=1 Tax=Salinisphaera sp. Q1T1-3 TaxID=2321229 RepID=UPI000E721098|nr:AraC family transcriptional regulator [Salinisphaera sp. Q1T1-3]RJS91003.1 AraC family transcriptional regulator [Salinisphaera sp. Q1T1-3]
MDDKMAELASNVACLGQEGLTSTSIANIGLLKVSRCSDLPPQVHRPVVSLIVQGEKQLTIGPHVLTYRAGHTFTASLDLPMLAKITEADSERPYLAISLAIDTSIVVELTSRMPDSANALPERGFSVDLAGQDLLDTYRRVLNLVGRPEEVPIMAPLLERELVYRLLKGPQGAALKRLATRHRRIARIHDALDLIRQNYTEPFSVEAVANAVGMSASAFHRRFKGATGMTPLQYHKTLRLYEARRLLLTGTITASAAAFAVGYQSVSQFMREYRRLFDTSPMRDARAQE